MLPRRIALAAAMAFVAASLCACVSNAERGLSRTTLKNRAKLQETMPAYRIVEGGLGVSDGGYTFHNERFRFEFQKELDNIPGYSSEEERMRRGIEASEALNGSYDFVQNIFGLSSPRTVRVVIRKEPPSPSTPAQVVWSSVDGSVMYFSVESFQDNTILAHEMAHALLTRYRIPAWMNEGIATLVEVDYAKSPRRDMRTPTPLLLNPEGYNAVQTWRAHGERLEPSVENVMYRASYGIIKETMRRFGDDIFVKFFQTLDRETESQARRNALTMSEIVRRIDESAGSDSNEAQQFFLDLKFKID